MHRAFQHNGKTLATRATLDGDRLVVGVYDGNRALYGADIPMDTISDMAKSPAAAHLASAAALMDQVEQDYKRYVDEVLPAIAQAIKDEGQAG